jgi:hypothetical protein
MSWPATPAVKAGADGVSPVAPRAPVRAGCGEARALTCRLVELVERDGLSIAAAARRAGVDVHAAGLLVRLHAIELECAEVELEERLEEIQEMCPGEDWWSYSDRQLGAILSGEAIPNRIVRELVLAWQRRTGQPTARLAGELRISPEALRRSLGLAAVSGRRQGCRPRVQKTITVQAAGRIVQATGIPACEVPGL